MILAKFAKKAGSLKGASTLTPIFKSADKNKDGILTKDEWLDFSAQLNARMTERYGGAYDLDEA